MLNINNYKSRAIIISGVHGIGKSLTIKLLLDELNYLPRIIYPNEIKDHRIFDDFNDFDVSYYRLKTIFLNFC